MADSPPSTMEANEQMTATGASALEFAGDIERIEQVEDGSAVIIHTKDGKAHVRVRCYPDQTVASIINHMYTDSLTVNQVGPALETRPIENEADTASAELECATCGKACKIYAPKSLEDALHLIKKFKLECSACIDGTLTCKRKSPFEERSNQDEPQDHGKIKRLKTANDYEEGTSAGLVAMSSEQSPEEHDSIIQPGAGKLAETINVGIIPEFPTLLAEHMVELHYDGFEAAAAELENEFD